ncbi:CHASE2 domain-containing protein [Chloroflexota bacterium]
MAIDSASESKKNRRQMKFLHHTLLLGAGCIFSIFFALVQPFHNINLWLSDQLFVPGLPSPNIVIAGIDDETFETYGRWASWPRSLHAQAINNLSNAGAKVIGFDILFTDRASDDEVMAAAMKSAGNIVLPLVGSEYQPTSDPKFTYTHILSPVSSLEPASVSIGHANLSPDPDGTVRRLPLVITDSGGQTYPAFSLAVLDALFAAPPTQEYLRQDGVLHILDRDIPVDTRYRFRINFTSEDQSRPYISYGDVIKGDFDLLAVENKIVLIGMAATGELDKWAVPISADKSPGVFIHATAIENILRQQFLTEVGAGISLMIMLLLVGITGFTLPRLGLRWGGVIVGFLFAGYLVSSFITFENGYILNILYPLLLLPLIYVSGILVQNAATVIENVKLNQKVSDGYKSTIMALAASIDAKDHYTRGHSQRVTEYALMGALGLSMSRQELETLEYAGILHDIGKIGMPDSILTNSNSLTPEEWGIVHQHPIIGANITKDIPFLEEPRKLLLHHHEKYDGTGYPDGLQGDDIPLGARLLAVADSFDSMTSDRSYRLARSTEDAIEELQKCSGKQFCPVAVNAFISEYRKHTNRFISSVDM